MTGEEGYRMEVKDYVLKDLKFKKRSSFPSDERKNIVEAVKNIQFKNFDDYKTHFEEKLAEKLKPYDYTNDESERRVFNNIKSQIKDSGRFKYEVDLYHPEKRIAIEVEKTKTTTLLLDVIKFVIGNKRKGQDGKPIIEFGVIIIPDKYRTKKYPNGHQDIPFNRLKNELAFINQILWVKDILIVVYDTSIFFNDERE